MVIWVECLRNACRNKSGHEHQRDVERRGKTLKKWYEQVKKSMEKRGMEDTEAWREGCNRYNKYIVVLYFCQIVMDFRFRSLIRNFQYFMSLLSTAKQWRIGWRKCKRTRRGWRNEDEEKEGLCDIKHYRTNFRRSSIGTVFTFHISTASCINSYLKWIIINAKTTKEN